MVIIWTERTTGVKALDFTTPQQSILHGAGACEGAYHHFIEDRAITFIFLLLIKTFVTISEQMTGFSVKLNCISFISIQPSLTNKEHRTKNVTSAKGFSKQTFRSFLKMLKNCPVKAIHSFCVLRKREIVVTASGKMLCTRRPFIRKRLKKYDFLRSNKISE